MAESTDISQFTPHEAPMLLLDRVIEAGRDYFVCEATVRADSLFDTQGYVPSYVGLEYMAQTIAAFSGYESSLHGESPKPGFLLGTRRFKTNVGRFSCGEKLSVSVHRQVQGASGLAAFDCVVLGDEIRQEATLTVFEPSDAQEFVRGN